MTFQASLRQPLSGNSDLTSMPGSIDKAPTTPEFSAADENFMRRALALAAQAEEAGEVPVGALVVAGDGEIIGEGFNQPIAAHDPSGHAEIMALRAAGQKLQNYRLTGSTVYVTLEPCAMCAMAMVHARVARVVFATPDPRTGAAGSVLDVLRRSEFNHQCQVEHGLYQEPAAEQLRAFFKARRK